MQSQSRNGAAVCAACGLCCTGGLFARVAVHADQVEPTRRLGLAVQGRADDTFVFEQPCMLYRGDHCSVHPHHPAACRAFRCRVLERYEAGDVSLDESLAIASEARALHDEIGRTGDPLARAAFDVLVARRF